MTESVPERLARAFPEFLRADAAAAAAVFAGAQLSGGTAFAGEVPGGRVEIPNRLYTGEPPGDAPAALSPRQRLLVHCLLTRHSDGYVRQQHVGAVLASGEAWAVPFVVALAGEYVRQIQEAILAQLRTSIAPSGPQRRMYGEFLARNPEFSTRTEQRAISYWSCYQVVREPEFRRSPGGELVLLLRDAAEEAAGRRWPTRLPTSAADRRARKRRRWLQAYSD